jgi:DNA-binding NtrC family response regulator
MLIQTPTGFRRRGPKSENCGSSKRKAVEDLGISLKTLYNKLNQTALEKAA